MSIILRQRFFQTKSALSQLDEELHRRVKRHNTTVVDMVAEKLCRRATAAAAVATIALCAMPVAPSWPLCAGVGTLWLAKMVGDLDTDTSNLVDCALSSEYVTMPPPDAVDRHELLAFCRSQLGMRYGIGTILAIAIDIVTWDWFP